MANISIPGVDDIRSGFPQPTVPKIEGEPSYETIQSVHDILKSNAASVQTTLGGGTHGHLGLVILPALYLVVTGHDFVAPANPGSTPTIPNGATNAQIGVITRQFNAEYKEYQECTRTDQALKQLLLGAVDDIYVSSLRNQYTGYTTLSTMNILTHLYDAYGQITDLDLDNNEKRMKTPYDPNLPIDNLFHQIEAAEEFAITGNSPFTARQIVNTAFLLIFASNAYNDECKEWKRRPQAQKTWANFKTTFMQAYISRRDLQKLQSQASASNLFGANVIKSNTSVSETTAASTLTDVFSDTSTTIEAIANATIESSNQVALLAQDNESLRAHVGQMQELLTAMQTNIRGSNQSNSTHPPSQYNRYTGRGRGIGRGRGRSRQPRGFDANSTHYCWTHGLTRTPYHTSQTCRDTDPGHKKEATFNKKLNGSKLKCHLANNTQNTEEA